MLKQGGEAREGTHPAAGPVQPSDYEQWTRDLWGIFYRFKIIFMGKTVLYFVRMYCSNEENEGSLNVILYELAKHIIPGHISQYIKAVDLDSSNDNQ